MQRKKSLRSIVPRFDENAVLKLIIALGVFYVMARFTIVLLMVYGDLGRAAEDVVNKLLGMPAVYHFQSLWWTLFTYGWVHYSFWQWLSNMIWLFVFGSSLQLLAGARHIFPLYVFSYLMGGAVYFLVQWLPFSALHIAPPMVLGAQAGIMGFAGALIAIAPHFKFYLAEHFSVRLWILVAIFMLLMLLGVGFAPLLILWLAGGGLAGFAYGFLFKNGWDPAEKMAFLKSRAHTDLNTTGSTPYQRQQKVDELLEKIAENGYEALTDKEKDLLRRESQNI